MNSDNPSALPQDEDLKAPDQGLPNPDDHMKRIEREGELNKVPTTPASNTGPDTTGKGQPTVQSVNQGSSLPAAAIPVENKFDGKTSQFYDPAASEHAAADKDRANRGGQKADF